MVRLSFFGPLEDFERTGGFFDGDGLTVFEGAGFTFNLESDGRGGVERKFDLADWISRDGCYDRF